MKVERSHPGPELQTVAWSAPVEASAPAFEASLRRHREQDASQREGQRRAEAASGRPASRTGVGGQRSAIRLLDTMLDASGCQIGGGRLPSSRHALSDAAPSLAAAVANELRRRRAHEADTGPCIEVEHSGTGVRLRLSRENGVWLVSFQSQSA